MKCVKCKHLLTKEEIDANLCWECGAIINSELISDDKEEAREFISNVEKAQKTQNKKEQKERAEEKNYEHSEHGVISAIQTYFTVLTIIAFIGGVIAGILAGSFLVAFLFFISISVSYCLVRLLISIAYLLSDIKDNTVLLRKGK